MTATGWHASNIEDPEGFFLLGRINSLAGQIGGLTAQVVRLETALAGRRDIQLGDRLDAKRRQVAAKRREYYQWRRRTAEYFEDVP